MDKSRRSLFSNFQQIARNGISIVCCLALLRGELALAVPSQQADSTQEQAAKLQPEQLDSLVAPIALYPDPLLSQMLVASTYPLEIIQLQQWLTQNKNLKDKALTEAVMKQGWDASVQGMAVLPDVVKQLAENIKWTTDLGNAFLAQQSEVMDAVQHMRAKANDKGNLKSNEHQKVETKVIESKQVIVIEPSSPEVVYVPSYNPTVVYGAPVYAYPPIAYPPVGYYAAGAAISFGIGMMVGAAWGGGGWGYNAGWGGNNTININNNNNFNRNSNIQGGNRNQVNGGNRNNWQHNPKHRGGAPYGDRGTANKFGGATRGDSLQNRQASARQNQGRQQSGNRGGTSAGTMDRGGARNASAKDRGGPAAGTMDRGGNRGGASAGTGGRSGGSDRVGNRSVSGSSSRSNSAFGGGSGASGRSARASSSRGSSSFGGGGGGRSGGGRSGGGGRRR